jgi:hypothetical protein
LRASIQHPFARLSAPARSLALLALAGLVIASGLALRRLDASLRTPASPSGIVSFEFAGSRERADRMLEAWGEPGRRIAEQSLWLDFLFLAGYAPGLALLCAAAADRARSARPRRAALGDALAWGQLAAGGLDALENLALLRVVAGAQGEAWPILAAAFAAPKFALVGAAFAYLVWSALASLGPRKRS